MSFLPFFNPDLKVAAYIKLYYLLYKEIVSNVRSCHNTICIQKVCKPVSQYWEYRYKVFHHL